MTRFFLWSFTVALAGFLFGFDTAVISGAEQSLEALWESYDTFHGLVTSSALWGTVLGAILGGIPTRVYGRKQTLIGVGILFFISAAGSALATDPYTFSIFRFIGGLGVGASTIAAPAYISEIAPAKKRGGLVAMYQLSIVVGITIAYLSNYLLRNIGTEPWRWMMGIEAAPALVYSVLVFFVPRSPRWLMLKGREKEARAILEQVNPGMDQNELVKIEEEKKNTFGDTIFSRAYRKPLMLVFFIALFNQFSGINAILYFMERILESAGLGDESAKISSIGVGVVNIAFTLVGMALIDRYGRKTLLYIGSVGYIVSLGLCSMAFFQEWSGNSVPLFLFLFIAAHAIGQGTVIWVFIAELFPNRLRASGQGFGSAVHWVSAALIALFMPQVMEDLGGGPVFAVFAGFMVLQLIWVHYVMPETKGASLEELGEKFRQR